MLNEAERKQIRESIERAELRTSGEIVPMVVRSSDVYPGARWRLAVAFAFLLSAGVLVGAPQVPTLYLWGALLPLIFVGHILARSRFLLRLALSKSEMQEEVHQRALEEFFGLGMHATRDRTGVLIFVSLLEHRIEVLADSGIDQRAPEGFWDDVVARLSKRIIAGEIAAGLVEAIDGCGELLQEHFPPREDDENELPDEVVVAD